MGATADRMGSMIADTARDLRSIALASTDASGYFPALYARVTSRIGAAIAGGTFADGPALDRFASGFASYYVSAVRDPAHRARCWKASWDVAADGRLLILQHLLIGINAHVNYDLARAVVAAADERGDLDSIRHDFDTVNDVLAATYVDVVHDLGRVSRWANVAAGIGGGDAFNFSLRVARARAWQAAERMYPMPEDGRRHYADELDRLVAVLAYLITKPSPPARPLLRLVRRLEEHDPAKVVAVLIGDP